MKKSILTLSILFLLSQLSFGQAKVTELPDISVIGNLIGQQSKSVQEFNVQEIEFAFQHNLYPGVKAEVFAALHKENGERKFELEEAFVTFSDLFGTLFPNQLSGLGIGAIVGQKRIGIGKLNAIHAESWDFVDRPSVINQFVGGDHGLAGEGLQLNYLLPLPFFSQVELGYWSIAAHEEGAGEAAHGVEYSNSVAQSRLWNGFALGEDKELQIGLNYAIGNPESTVQITQQHLVGTDITYTQELGNDREIQLQSEVYQATYGEEGEVREEQTGAYVAARYKFNNFYKLAARYSQLGKHGDEGSEQSQYAVSLTKQLTETSKFRVQYNSGDAIEDTVFLQFLFGFGPHSHVLQ